MIVNRPEDFNFYLGETADMIRETVSSFAQNEIAPRAAEIDKKNDFPSDLWEKMGDLGILGVTVEEKWGGSGLGYLEHTVCVEEISRASASVGLSYGAHSNLCINVKSFGFINLGLDTAITIRSPFFIVFVNISILLNINSLTPSPFVVVDNP